MAFSLEVKMKNKIFVLCIIFLSGCVSTQGKLTTFVDYLHGDRQNPDQEEASKKKKKKKRRLKKYTEQDGHDLTFARTWSYPLNGDLKGERYTGVKATITNPNDFFRFNLAVLMSPTLIISEESSSEGGGLVEIVSTRSENFYIISPSLSAPVVRYDLDLSFGSGLRVKTNIEFRTGIGYEWRIIYISGIHDLYILGEEVEDVYLPSNISNDSYLSQGNTLDINIGPVHFEANLMFSGDEIRLSYGIGAGW